MRNVKWKKGMAVCLALVLCIGCAAEYRTKRAMSAESSGETVSAGAVSGPAAEEDAVTATPDTTEGASATPAVTATGSAASAVPAVVSATPAAVSVSPAADLTAYKPAAPSISARGGSARVRLTWNSIVNADGYYIYMRSPASSVYERIKTVTGGKTTEFVKKSLEQGATYYFRVSAYRMVGGTAAEGELSIAASASTASVAKTSTAAKKYSTKSKFQKSLAYKTYTKMKSYMNYSNCFAIPGMKNTNVAGFASTSMVPQGICLAGSYLLISAYDYTGTDYSVIYVVNKAAKTYVTTIVLPSKAKVGGLAFDGENVWVSKGSSVGCFPYSVVTAAAVSGSKFVELGAYKSVCKVDTTAGFLGYYNGVLWVGKTNYTSKSTMYGYYVSNASTFPTLNQKLTMSIPSKTQGIAFTAAGDLILTRSYRTKKSKSGYISKIRTYSPSYNEVGTGGQVKKNAVRENITMPPMIEGVAVYGNYTYAVFSSSYYKSCKYPVDRVIALKTAKLL